MLKINDKVLIKDAKNNWYIGTIININDYREPSQKYCVELDPIYKPNDVIFIGEENILYNARNSLVEKVGD